MTSNTHSVKAQYERYPYPPIGVFALPRTSQNINIRYEQGTVFAFGAARSHRGIRILVAGSGTFEALVVAQQHPQAREVVAIDLSAASLSRLKCRIAFFRLMRFIRRLPPITVICADLHEWEGGQFDFILASNMLQSAPDPAWLFHRLSGWLSPGGIFRVVTYPKASRIWIRQTALWLSLHGLSSESPNLTKRARAAIGRLPKNHPIRSCYDSHGEVGTLTGLVDAFFPGRENPLSPLEWGKATVEAGLTLVAETQTETSRSSFLDEIAPEGRHLPSWLKLQILDDLLELCASPVFWFKKGDAPALPSPWETERLPEMEHREQRDAAKPQCLAHGTRLEAGGHGEALYLPSRVRWEMSKGLIRIQAHCRGLGLSLAVLFERLKDKVGPRVSRSPWGKVLPGLSITDYPLEALIQAVEPWSSQEWSDFERQLGEGWCLYKEDVVVPGSGLVNQSEWIQLFYGPAEGIIPIQLKKNKNGSLKF